MNIHQQIKKDNLHSKLSLEILEFKVDLCSNPSNATSIVPRYHGRPAPPQPLIFSGSRGRRRSRHRCCIGSDVSSLVIPLPLSFDLRNQENQRTTTSKRMERRKELVFSSLSTPSTKPDENFKNAKEERVPKHSTDDSSEEVIYTQKKNLHTLLHDLQIDINTPRYRKRAINRRSAMSTSSHPPFNPNPSPVPDLNTDNTSTELYVNTEPKQCSLSRRGSLIADVSKFVDTHISCQTLAQNEVEKQPPFSQLRKSTRRFSLILQDALNQFKTLESTAPRESSAPTPTSEGMFFRMRRSSLILTQNIISVFVKNHGDKDDSEEGSNVLLETMIRNESVNLLNTLKYRERE